MYISIRRSSPLILKHHNGPINNSRNCEFILFGLGYSLLCWLIAEYDYLIWIDFKQRLTNYDWLQNMIDWFGLISGYVWLTDLCLIIGYYWFGLIAGERDCLILWFWLIAGDDWHAHSPGDRGGQHSAADLAGDLQVAPGAEAGHHGARPATQGEPRSPRQNVRPLLFIYICREHSYGGFSRFRPSKWICSCYKSLKMHTNTPKINGKPPPFTTNHQL